MDVPGRWRRIWLALGILAGAAIFIGWCGTPAQAANCVCPAGFAPLVNGSGCTNDVVTIPCGVPAGPGVK
jgi:hypothetical protein